MSLRTGCGFGLVLLISVSVANAQQEFDLARIGALHRTGPGVGYDTSFSSFDGFLSIYHDQDSLLFSDTRLLVSNDSLVSANLGGGYRAFNGSSDAIFGGNLYYDVRDSGNATFGQIGGGLERLTDDLDLRFNFYAPVGKGSQFLGQSMTSEFVNSNIFTTQRSFYEVAFNQVELEAGVPLDLFPNADTRGYLAYYYLESAGRDANGVRARLEVLPLRNLSMNLQVTHDAIFNTTVSLQVAVHLPGLRTSTRERRTLRERLFQPVHRNQNIALETQSVVTQQGLAINPATSNPFVVTHFDSAAAAGGDGSIDNPFDTLPDGTVSGDILFAHADSVFDNQSIVLSDAQRFLGEGKDHFFTTSQGSYLLPRATMGTNLPVIQNFAGTAITLGNDTEVSGFTINNVNTAIYGMDISSVLLNCNTITTTVDEAIQLNNVAGSNTITNNVIDNSGSHSIDIDTFGATVANYDIAGNLITNSNADGINARADGNSELTLALSGNTFDGISDDAIEAVVDDNAMFTLSLDGETFQNITDDAVFVNSNDNTTTMITSLGSTFTNIGGDGISTNNDDNAAVTMVLTNNTFNTIGDDAVSISNDSGSGTGVIIDGTFTGNTFMNVGGDGVFMNSDNDVNSNLLIDSNQFLAITGNGININLDDDQVITMVVNENLFDGIGGDGILLSGAADANLELDWTLTNNTFNNVTDDGIDLNITADDGAVATFLISGNAFNSPGGSGIEVFTSRDDGGTLMMSMRIIDNVFTETGANAIDMNLTDDTDADIQIANNTFQLTGVEAVEIDTSDDTSVCLEIMGNTTNADIDLNNGASNIFNIETTGGGAPFFYGNTLLDGSIFSTTGTTDVAVGTCGFPAP